MLSHEIRKLTEAAIQYGRNLEREADQQALPGPCDALYLFPGVPYGKWEAFRHAQRLRCSHPRGHPGLHGHSSVTWADDAREACWACHTELDYKTEGECDRCSRPLCNNCSTSHVQVIPPGMVEVSAVPIRFTYCLDAASCLARFGKET